MYNKSLQTYIIYTKIKIKNSRTNVLPFFNLGLLSILGIRTLINTLLKIICNLIFVLIYKKICDVFKQTSCVYICAYVHC